jgi:hypothetical protein
LETDEDEKEARERLGNLERISLLQQKAEELRSFWRNSVTSIGPPGGAHPTQTNAIAKISQYLNITTDDMVWDIGVGEPFLALYFSWATQKPVIGNDVGK